MKRKIGLICKLLLVPFTIAALLVLSNPFEVSLLFHGIGPNSFDMVDDFIDSEHQHVRVIQTVFDDQITLIKMHETPFGVWHFDETASPEQNESSIGYLIHASIPKPTAKFLTPSGGPWVDGPQVQETRVYLFGDKAKNLISVPDSLLQPNQTVAVKQYSAAYVIKIHSYEPVNTSHPTPQSLYQSIRRIYALLVSIA